MTTAHVYFADIPLSSPSSSSATSVAAAEGHRSNFEPPNSDATSMQRQCNRRNANERSISPGLNTNTTAMHSTPRYERNMGFFRQLSRRFGLRSNDDLVYSASNEEDNQSSSTDSCSSHRENANKDAQQQRQYCNASNIMTASMMTMSITEHISCASSETSSTVDIEEQQQQQQSQLPEDDDDDAADENKQANGKQSNTNGCHKDRKSFARSSFSRLHRRSASSIRRAFENFSLSSRSLSCSGTTPPPPPPSLSLTTHHQHTSSSSSSSTPIKSALKSTSNLELNKKYNSTSSASASTSSSSSAATASGSTATTKSNKNNTKPPPQRILRQPVSYTYLKGISGLPTQRVPRNSVCCQYARR
ncbi:uncharacterized protein DDB_G0271670 [Musca vetustissima]|uniref:uncharacterized protein DDB_G0271670 n=1 Tax=Musca vetustissima TaxID=27455 RepID=UPI002AB734CA|nr:uncharacterized protein DDB_G0271670 [Musca vetustissima]